jgi:hypothetical protein
MTVFLGTLPHPAIFAGSCTATFGFEAYFEVICLRNKCYVVSQPLWACEQVLYHSDSTGSLETSK